MSSLADKLAAMSPEKRLYLLLTLPTHLVNAGQQDRAKIILLDYAFLQAKLDAIDVNALIADCEYLSDDDAIRLLKSALGNANHVLKEDKSALAHQLVGRLMTWRAENPPIKSFTDDILNNVAGIYPADPDSPYAVLNPAGSALLGTLEGHTRGVNGALELSDGRLLSWSNDETLRLWERDGTASVALTGHTDQVRGALELSDGRLLSWSHSDYGNQDHTLRLWERDGSASVALTGHTGSVRGVLELRDGRLLSRSGDRTLRLWERDGTASAVLTGHTDVVNGALELSDGRLLSWSVEPILRLWERDGTASVALTGV
jgi:WD40 repeat protein